MSLEIFISYGAPYRLTRFPYSYTVVSKRNTDKALEQKSLAKQGIHRALERPPDLAVLAFLGEMDWIIIYILHGAGLDIHMPSTG
jgi:hypothetical protein